MPCADTSTSPSYSPPEPWPWSGWQWDAMSLGWLALSLVCLLAGVS
jgi:hypothetical protein